MNIKQKFLELLLSGPLLGIALALFNLPVIFIFHDSNNTFYAMLFVLPAFIGVVSSVLSKNYFYLFKACIGYSFVIWSTLTIGIAYFMKNFSIFDNPILGLGLIALSFIGTAVVIVLFGGMLFIEAIIFMKLFDFMTKRGIR